MIFFKWILADQWRLAVAILIAQALAVFIAFKFGRGWVRKKPGQIQLVCNETGKIFPIDNTTAFIEVHFGNYAKQETLVVACPCGKNHTAKLNIKYSGIPLKITQEEAMQAKLP
ncbi:MAG TPA: hypothetical protein DCX32_01370 [Candidatus Moranbacteria bacterium]|nr:MAG: hypothetical protein UW95_C0007G0015 [Parcubacteria group bacterium GW2011_GWC1_45_14]HAV11173.1 hypothetical protein [Candidatus Moranbacteria bacterium]